MKKLLILASLIPIAPQATLYSMQQETPVSSHVRTITFPSKQKLIALIIEHKLEYLNTITDIIENLADKTLHDSEYIIIFQTFLSAFAAHLDADMPRAMKNQTLSIARLALTSFIDDIKRLNNTQQSL
jgi:hypothetical protein